MGVRHTLNYTANGQALNVDQRAMEAALQTSGFRWGFERSQGERPAEAMLPHRYAPTRRVITDQGLSRHSVVIPVGTIVSAVPVMSRDYYYRNSTVFSGSPIDGSGDTYSGELVLGTGNDSSVLTAPADDAIDGYGKVNAALIIANGGSSVDDLYTSYDYTDLGRLDKDGNAITNVTVFNRPPNIPIGVVFNDIYIEDTGATLNFVESPLMKFSSILCDWYVEIPYCANIANYGMSNTLASGTTQDINNSSALGYNAVYNLGLPFLTAASLADLVPGGFVSADLNGKYKMQNVAANSYTASKTAQTVGKLTALDNKFPKDIEDLVQMYNLSAAGGTATYGLPSQLFAFVFNILKYGVNGGTNPTFAQIIAAVDSGDMGMARINLHVA